MPFLSGLITTWLSGQPIPPRVKGGTKVVAVVSGRGWAGFGVGQL